MSVDAGRPRVAVRVLLGSLRAMAHEGITSYVLGKVKEVARFCVQGKLGAYFLDSLINGWELSFGDVG